MCTVCASSMLPESSAAEEELSVTQVEHKEVSVLAWHLSI